MCLISLRFKGSLPALKPSLTYHLRTHSGLLNLICLAFLECMLCAYSLPDDDFPRGGDEPPGPQVFFLLSYISSLYSILT